MNSFIKQQPSVSTQSMDQQNGIEMKISNKEKSIEENVVQSRDNFPKGLRGGGPCFDCLACLCCCCAIEEIACFECCKDC